MSLSAETLCNCNLLQAVKLNKACNIAIVEGSKNFFWGEGVRWDRENFFGGEPKFIDNLFEIVYIFFGKKGQDSYRKIKLCFLGWC